MQTPYTECKGRDQTFNTAAGVGSAVSSETQCQPTTSTKHRLKFHSVLSKSDRRTKAYREQPADLRACCKLQTGCVTFPCSCTHRADDRSSAPWKVITVIKTPMLDKINSCLAFGYVVIKPLLICRTANLDSHGLSGSRHLSKFLNFNQKILCCPTVIYYLI